MRSPIRREVVYCDELEMVGAIGFEFWVRRSFNNIEARRAPLKQWKAVVDSANGSQMDHKRITALVWTARSSL
jgi:hypothetical protein